MKKNEQLETLIDNILNEMLVVLATAFEEKNNNEKHLSLTIKDFMALDSEVLYMLANIVVYMLNILKPFESYMREHMSKAAVSYENFLKLKIIFNDVSALGRKHAVDVCCLNLTEE